MVFSVRNAKTSEFERIGELLIRTYSGLNGFLTELEHPEYYDLLKNVGRLTQNKNVELLVAVSEQDLVAGAVVYFHDMMDYGAGGTATFEKNACGFRLLCVDGQFRGFGIGKLLTNHCIEKGRKSRRQTMVIHTTESMHIAWGMYEKLGFKRATDLDFYQGELPVFGFRIMLNEKVD